MRLPISLFAAAAVTLVAGAAQAASVEIEDAVLRVTVIPENRTDTKVEWVKTHPGLPMQVRTVQGRTVIDGDQGRQIRGCRGAGDRTVVHVRGLGDIAYADMPQVVIRTPRDVSLEAEGAVFGAIGRSGSVELSNAGCGDWTIANTEGRLKVSQAGSGNTRAGSAGSARLRIAGSGDVAAADIRGGLDVNIAGSGDVAVASISGPLEVSVAGSGDVTVGGGRATAMAVSVAGSGDIEFDGVADSLKARIAGSGDVRVKQVTGEVSRTVMGSGNINIGG
ncbi:GIN domain-containing protein [Phenylobacterium sp.]|uniref:GIN domain-containing protein n=1 Tax=Phenylobacterium sp. TaxID=1871053 RepID=UPI002FE22F11